MESKIKLQSIIEKYKEVQKLIETASDKSILNSDKTLEVILSQLDRELKKANKNINKCSTETLENIEKVLDTVILTNKYESLTSTNRGKLVDTKKALQATIALDKWSINTMISDKFRSMSKAEKYEYLKKHKEIIKNNLTPVELLESNIQRNVNEKAIQSQIQKEVREDIEASTPRDAFKKAGRLVTSKKIAEDILKYTLKEHSKKPFNENAEKCSKLLEYREEIEKLYNSQNTDGFDNVMRSFK